MYHTWFWSFWNPSILLQPEQLWRENLELSFYHKSWQKHSETNNLKFFTHPDNFKRLWNKQLKVLQASSKDSEINSSTLLTQNFKRLWNEQLFCISFASRNSFASLSQPEHLSPENLAERLEEAMPCHNYKVFQLLVISIVTHCHALSHIVTTTRFFNS